MRLPIKVKRPLTQNRALKNLLKFTGKPLEAVIRTLTENPAKLLKLENRIGFIQDSADADLVLLDEDSDIAGVFQKGRRVK